VNGALSKLKIIGLWVLLLVTFLGGQAPDYDLNPWTGDSFEEKSEPFFEMLALQTTPVRTTISSDEGRLVIGLHLSGGVSSSGDNLGLVFGKGGVFPSLEGDYWVARNLKLHGTFAGFETTDDIVFANSYGFTYKMGDEENSKWSLSFLRSRLEGPDEEGVVGMLTLRGDKKISSKLEAGMELRLSPAAVSVTLGLYGLL